MNKGLKADLEKVNELQEEMIHGLVYSLKFFYLTKEYFKDHYAVEPFDPTHYIAFEKEIKKIIEKYYNKSWEDIVKDGK